MARLRDLKSVLAQISIEAMKLSLAEFLKVVQSNVNNIQEERLHDLANDIIVELDEIERITSTGVTANDFKLIDKSKVIIMKAIDELCKSVHMNCKRPKNLIESHFIDIQGANESVELK